MPDEKPPTPRGEEPKSGARSWAHTAQVVFVTAIIVAFLAYLAHLGQL